MAEDGKAAGLNRPRPPANIASIDNVRDGIRFVPAPELADWILATFIEDGAPLQNEEHAHLRDARIGVLWTIVENGRNGRSIVGQAELGSSIGGMGKWTKARAEQQIVEWFGDVPDFVITFYAPYADSCDDATFCALVEHELSHCAQEKDEYGVPRFKKSTGLPAFCMRGHDVEEFISVVRRYGADAAGVRAMIDAAAEGPTIASADIGFACGTCQR
jgi:hypothetical protein